MAHTSLTNEIKFFKQYIGRFLRLWGPDNLRLFARVLNPPFLELLAHGIDAPLRSPAGLDVILNHCKLLGPSEWRMPHPLPVELGVLSAAGKRRPSQMAPL